jgi:ribonuclease HII
MKVVIGVDESGTGAWAGPYTVCALASFQSDDDLLREAGGRDSKRMTDIRRRAAVIKFLEIALFAKTVAVSVQDIDRSKKNAWRSAIVSAVAHVLECLLDRGIDRAAIEVIIDGLPDPATQKKISKELGVRSIKFLTSAEDQVPSVGAASVIAKTVRNDLMAALHEEYPVYRWIDNKGYGSAQHAEAIEKYGRSPQHRDLKVEVLVRKRREE